MFEASSLLDIPAYWQPLAPALALIAYFVGGFAIYLGRVVTVGPWRDDEIERRGSTALLGLAVRRYFTWLMRPLWLVLRWAEVPATAITTLSVLLALASGVAVASGHFALGGWLYLTAGLCDFFDGRLARDQGTAGSTGALLDSVLDRYADAAIFVGLSWYYRDTWVLAPALLGVLGTLMVPYVRARGEGLGYSIRVGAMPRPERVVYLGASVALAPVVHGLWPTTWFGADQPLAILGIVLIAGFANVTALQRLAVGLRHFQRKDRAAQLPASERALQFGRFTASAFVATAIDFGVVLLAVEWIDIHAGAATAVGCAVGGVINFVLNRSWTFGVDGAALGQAGRYTFVSASSAALNAGGVALLIELPAFHYIVAWVLVRALVFAAWNYPLQSNYVFVRACDRSTADAADRCGPERCPLR